MQIFPFFHNLAILLFSEIVILRRRPILLSLVWLQTQLDSTQSYFHYLLFWQTRTFTVGILWLYVSSQYAVSRSSMYLQWLHRLHRGPRYRTCYRTGQRYISLNRLCPSWLLPLSQNESSCIHVKDVFPIQFIFIKLNFPPYERFFQGLVCKQSHKVTRNWPAENTQFRSKVPKYTHFVLYI